MIGKRNQFSKFKVIKAVPSTQPKVKVNAFVSEGEEVEEEEEEEEEEKIAEKHEEPKPDAVTKPSKNEHTTEIEPTVAPEGDKNNSIGETDAINKSNVKTADGETPEDTSSVKSSTQPQTTEQTTEEEDEATAQKKRRQRARQRANKQQRQDVDMDMNELAEHEDDEKYAKWVPPTNQSGDGFTHLNDKFGY